MKKYWKLIVGVAAFVAFMVIAGVVYGKLSEDYKPEQNLVTGDGGSNKVTAGQEKEEGETGDATEGGRQESTGENAANGQQSSEE